MGAGPGGHFGSAKFFLQRRNGSVRAAPCLPYGRFRFDHRRLGGLKLPATIAAARAGGAILRNRAFGAEGAGSAGAAAVDVGFGRVFDAVAAGGGGAGAATPLAAHVPAAADDVFRGRSVRARRRGERAAGVRFTGGVDGARRAGGEGPRTPVFYKNTGTSLRIRRISAAVGGGERPTALDGAGVANGRGAAGRLPVAAVGAGDAPPAGSDGPRCAHRRRRRDLPARRRREDRPKRCRRGTIEGDVLEGAAATTMDGAEAPDREEESRLHGAPGPAASVRRRCW